MGIPVDVPVGAARRGRRARPWGARGCGVVGADVLGGPRTRWRPRGRPRGRGAPGTSRPTMGCAWVWRGRGRRPRRPAYPWASPWASPWTSPLARRAGDVAPYHGVRVVRGVVGADVLGGPRPRWRPRGCPRGRGAPGTSRPTMGYARACGVVGADVPARGCLASRFAVWG